MQRLVQPSTLDCQQLPPLSAMYEVLELSLSHDEDGILPRLGGSGDGGVVQDEGPTSYGQVSRAIAAGGARRTMHRTLQKGTNGTHMAMTVLAVVLVVMMERRSERG